MSSVDVLKAVTDARPGDVLVLSAGDTRQVASVTRCPNPAYTSVTWSDGRVSLLDTHTPRFRLHPPQPKPTVQETTSDDSTDPAE